MKEKLKYLPLALKILFLTIFSVIIYRDRDSWYRFCRYPFPFIMCRICDYPCFFHTYRLQRIIALSAGTTGLVTGRVFCGIICPVGTVQDGLHSLKRWVFSLKIFTSKGLTASLGSPRGAFDSSLRFLKYPLLLLVLLYSLIRHARAIDFMPEIILIPAMHLTRQVREIAGSGYINFWLFFLIIVFGIGLLLHRPWCKYLCPIGLLFAFFNKISFLRIRLQNTDSTGWRKCLENCTTEKPPNKLEKGFVSIECVRCYNCVLSCPEGAVQLKVSGRS